MDHVCEADPIHLPAQLALVNGQTNAQNGPREHEYSDLASSHGPCASNDEHGGVDVDLHPLGGGSASGVKRSECTTADEAEENRPA